MNYFHQALCLLLFCVNYSLEVSGNQESAMQVCRIIYARDVFWAEIHCQSFLKDITHGDYAGFQKAFFHKDSEHNKEMLNSEDLVFSSCKSHQTLLQRASFSQPQIQTFLTFKKR